MSDQNQKESETELNQQLKEVYYIAEETVRQIEQLLLTHPTQDKPFQDNCLKVLKTAQSTQARIWDITNRLSRSANLDKDIDFEHEIEAIGIKFKSSQNRFYKSLKNFESNFPSLLKVKIQESQLGTKGSVSDLISLKGNFSNNRLISLKSVLSKEVIPCPPACKGDEGEKL